MYIRNVITGQEKNIEIATLELFHWDYMPASLSRAFRTLFIDKSIARLPQPLPHLAGVLGNILL